MAKQILELSLRDIIPSSIADDEQVRAMIKALDQEIGSVSQDIREALIIPRIDELPEDVIDLLAWQWHVDFYELARTLEMKRETVRGSIPWHRKKGTVWAIKRALEMIGIKAEVVEWWKTDGATPYTFSVEAEITSGFWSHYPDSKDAAKVIRAAIMESKAARSWLSNLVTVIKTEAEQRIYHGIATLGAVRQRIRPVIPPSESFGALRTGIAALTRSNGIVWPSMPREIGSGLFAGVAVVAAGFITILPEKEVI